jgi:hypothetical protein
MSSAEENLAAEHMIEWPWRLATDVLKWCSDHGFNDNFTIPWYGNMSGHDDPGPTIHLSYIDGPLDMNGDHTVKVGIARIKNPKVATLFKLTWGGQ